MDHHECRRLEETLDRKAWMVAYRDARLMSKRGQRGPSLAGDCLQARLAAESRLADLNFNTALRETVHRSARPL